MSLVLVLILVLELVYTDICTNTGDDGVPVRNGTDTVGTCKTEGAWCRASYVRDRKEAWSVIPT